MPDQLPLFPSLSITVRDLRGALQPDLFPIPKPTPKDIRALVKERLYGFKFRQRARDQKREEYNKQNRKRVGERRSTNA
jgi:hypothetical protein